MTPRDYHRLVRAAWIAAFIMGGTGLLIYGIAWFSAVAPPWLLVTIGGVAIFAFLVLAIYDTSE